MYKIAICDDNRLHAEEMENEIERVLADKAELYSFYSAEELRCAMREGAGFDIVFMDIRLSDENGVALVAELFPKGCGSQVIYITAYGDYHTKVYATEHIWFLTKPVQRQDMEAALRKALANLSEERSRRIAVKFGDSLRLLAPEEIIYAESEKRRLHIITAAGELLTYQTLEQFAEGLDKRFLICHKSYLVNMDRVRAMESDHFLMDNGVGVPISRQRFATTRRAFLDYIGEKL